MNKNFELFQLEYVSQCREKASAAFHPHPEDDGRTTQMDNRRRVALRSNKNGLSIRLPTVIFCNRRLPNCGHRFLEDTCAQGM